MARTGAKHGRSGLPLNPAALERNAILRALRNSTAALVLKRGTLVQIALRQRIYEAEKPIDSVYFPLDSVL